MESAQSKLLIRADAGPMVGTGHVMRTLALGQAWKRQGGSVAFVCGDLPHGLFKTIEAEDFQIYQVRNGQCAVADAKDTVEIASAIQPNWIVLDGYRFDDTYQRTFRNIDARLMIIDDHPQARNRRADIVVNQNLKASTDLHHRSGQARILAGPEFALLRSEFTDFHRERRKPRPIRRQARRILITMGGVDPDNWTLKTLQVLSDLNRQRLIVDCVTGPFYEHLTELAHFKKTANLSLRVHRNVDRMSALMERVDLAITSGRSTCFELARCGVPSIVMAIAEDQWPVVQSMSCNNVMISIDCEDWEATKHQREFRLAASVQQLINDPERRREMSASGMQLVDGRGANRIAIQMAASSYRFRKANPGDVETLWRWRNDPEVRSVSLDETRIPFESHQRWMNRRLDDPNTILWVWEDFDGRPVGLVRFELREENPASALISIIVDQTRRGRGLGAVLIVAACDKLTEGSAIEQIVAQIKPGNAPSERAFRAAGFQLIEPVIADGKMAFQYALGRNSSVASTRSTRKKSA